MDVDGAYSWLRRPNPQFKTYIATPEIAYQRSSRTDISEPTWRDRVVEHIGRPLWMTLYSLASLLGLWLIIRGYAQARAEPQHDIAPGHQAAHQSELRLFFQ